MTLKIKHVSVRSIMGLQELEFTPNTGFNEITGHNGAGKTSVLEAIKAGIGGAADATLLRKGEQQGEVVLLLDDDKTRIRKSVTEAGTKTEITRDGKKVAKPTDALKALTDMMSVNPVDFLRAPKKDRVRVLLDSMPLVADAAEIGKRAGFDVVFPEGTHALFAIDSTHRAIFEQRTGTNRAIKEKEGTISQLRDAVPEAPGGVEGDEDSLVAQVDTAKAAHEAQRKRIDEHLGKLRAANQAEVSEISDETARRVQELQEQIIKIKAETGDAITAKRAELQEKESKAAAARQANDAKLAEFLQPLQVGLQAIRANRDLAAKRQSTLALIEQMVDEAAELQEEADSQTAALAALEKYKSDLLSDLPIKGLEVRDGEVYRDGVHLDRLNTAQQVQIAVEVAKLRAGELGVVVVDGIELLDSESYEQFRQQAEASGLQMFVTRVTDDGFTVNP